MKIKYSNFLSAGIGALILGGCAAADGGSSSLLEIAGTLNVASSSSVMDFSSQANIMASTYSVRCVTLSGTPQAGIGEADDAGAFSLSLDNSENSPVGCFVLEGTSIIASMAFESSDEGMSGGNSQEGTYTPSAGTTKLDFKTVTIDKDKGTAVVSKAAVEAENGGEAEVSGDWASMTGDWTIKAVEKVPEGYIGPCAAGTAEQDCDGPMDGMEIHFAEYKAQDAGAKEHTGLALWQSSATKTACFGGGGGEGADLPSGWSAKSGSSELTNAMGGLTTTFPDPADINVPSQGVCNDTTATTCDQVQNGLNGSDWEWDNSGTGVAFTDAQCQFMCVVNEAHEFYKSDSFSGCGGRYDIQWDSFGFELGTGTDGVPTYSGGWTNVDYDSTEKTFLNDSVRFEKDPEGRFLFGEIILNGNIGTLTDSRSWEFDECTGTEGSEDACDTKVTCKFTENTKMTIIQDDASNVTMELIMETRGASTNVDKCTEREDRRGSQKWFFKAIKG